VAWIYVNYGCVPIHSSLSDLRFFTVLSIYHISHPKTRIFAEKVPQNHNASWQWMINCYVRRLANLQNYLADYWACHTTCRILWDEKYGIYCTRTPTPRTIQHWTTWTVNNEWEKIRKYVSVPLPWAITPECVWTYWGKSGKPVISASLRTDFRTGPSRMRLCGADREKHFVPSGVKYLFCNTYRPYGGARPLSAASNIRN